MPIVNSKAPALRDIEGWINSEPLSLGSGTYLLDFWTYSSVRSVRMLPLLKQVNRLDEDLQVLGVHSPRFDFERDVENVERAVRRYGIGYPVALDTDNSTWRAYGNRYRPRHALVHEGDLLWQHMGESSLEGLGEKLADILDVEELDFSHDPHDEGTPRVFLGFRKAPGVNEEGVFRGEKEFSAPEFRRPGEVYLDGSWKMEDQFLEARGGSSMFFSFEGSEVSIVADPRGGVRDVEVGLDGSAVDGKDAGSDLRVEDGRSYVRIKSPGLYSVVSTDMRRADLRLEPEEKTRLFSMSFR